MTLGVGNLVALICIVISILFAIVTHQATNALWWALLAKRCYGGEPGHLGEAAEPLISQTRSAWWPRMPRMSQHAGRERR